VLAPYVPVPPTEVEVNAIDTIAGNPVGLLLPEESFAVSVAVKVPPEFTELIEATTVL
jgi:hypothetical protein